jgi:multidrug efflux pump subunit AcrA (membrane-fusion protein)
MTVPPIRKAGTPISVIATEAVLAAALIFAGGLFAGCGNNVNASSAGPRPAMKVAVVKAEQSDVPLSGEWVGTLDGFVNAQIQPQANGYLILQNYREGSQVEKGQVLFEIDPRPFTAALQQAQGQLGQAQAQLSSRADQRESRYALGGGSSNCEKPTRQRHPAKGSGRSCCAVGRGCRRDG